MIFGTIEGGPGAVSQVLAYLKTHNSRFASVKEIKESLNITRQKALDSITFLREAGYAIETKPDDGFRLISSPDIILPVEISAGLNCQRFGCRVFSYNSVGSTNHTAHDFAKAGMPEGTIVIADSQTKGRGRLGRSWYSQSGKGLYFSLILRPKLMPSQTPGISLIAGLAVIRAIYSITGLQMSMKWPNDILSRDKKLAGILVELEAELDRVDYVIVGIGVNINHTKKDFPRHINRIATSLKIETGKSFTRAALLQQTLVHFEKIYDNFCNHGLKYLAKELLECSAVYKKKVSLSLGKREISGTVVGFDDNGGLLIKSKNKLQAYSAGEITMHQTFAQFLEKTGSKRKSRS
ncbi:MAG: biotin--[acetyl-CoA-carboxylase] ligase [candidate division Zixibacteria bacterium]|nr:biotin--[acetyl-CoA-carboxylase] ligase [candidate division Zixibacteria bacterium]